MNLITIVLASVSVCGFALFGLIIIRAWTLAQALKWELEAVREVDKE